MVTIILNIPDNKIQIVKDGLLYLHPVPIEDAEPGEIGEPIMSEGAWLREWLRRKLRNEIARGLQRRAIDDVAFIPDDTLVE